MDTDAQTAAAEPPATAIVTPQASESLSARDRLVIGILLVSTFVVILNETIMAVALPRLMADLGVTASAVQWLSTAFMLTMAVVIPVTGFLIQRMHTRPVFLIAMAFFCTGTLICALAPGLPVLIFGRVVQATGTAIMVPLLMTTVMTLVPASSRGRIMGNLTIVISVAPAVGPTISGIVLTFLDWRWMFGLVLPIALAAMLLGFRRIPNVSEPRYAPVDVISVPLSALAFGGLVYGLSRFGDVGSDLAPAWWAFGIGAVTLVLFVGRQLYLQKENRALLDLRTFTSKIFSISLLLACLSMGVLLGVMILLPIYMQNALGLTALQTGLLLLPGGLIMGLMSPKVGHLYDLYGPKPLLVPGVILMTGVMAWLATLDVDTPYLWLLAAHVILSVGLGLLFTPLFTVSMSAVPGHLYSHGSAALAAFEQVAGAAGTALFVALMSLRTASLAAAGVNPAAALAGGIRLAFMVGAAISVFAVVCAVFVKKPEEGAAPAMH